MALKMYSEYKKAPEEHLSRENLVKFGTPKRSFYILLTKLSNDLTASLLSPDSFKTLSKHVELDQILL